MSLFLDALLDACLDTLRIFPFLLVTYLFMEWLEHGAGRRFAGAVARGGRVGPLIGVLLGVVPQCGFSGAAATLYAGRVVTLGTMLAVFLATSDEMLPIMLSQAVEPQLIIGILAVKVIAGLAFGFVIDALLARAGRLHVGFASKRMHAGHEGNDICQLCEDEGCSCGHEHGHEHEHVHEHVHEHSHGDGHGPLREIVLPALKHSLSVTVFILIVTLLINLVAEAGLEDALAAVTTIPYLSAVVTAIIGLIPNCAVSVACTQLYLDGLLSGGALISGLCANAGIGLLVLLRTNKDPNENLRVIGTLVACGIIVGFIVEALGLF